MAEEITFTYEDDEGWEHEAALPARYAVCPTCEGRGSHVHRAIDGNGITASEWAEWDIDERDDYLSGRYDVQCEECKGLRVVLVVDEEQLSDEEKKLHEIYLEQQTWEQQYRMEVEAERRMGA